MNAVDKVLASPRRAVRYVYLRDFWVEAAGLDPHEAILAAPDDAVIAALTREIDNLSNGLVDERARADQAERRLKSIATAAAILADLVEAEKP